MNERKFGIFCLILLLLLQSVTSDSVCSVSCIGGGNPEAFALKYPEGAVYTYKVIGKTSIVVPSSLKGGKTTMKYEFDVEIVNKGKCLFSARFKNIVVSTMDGEKYGASDLEGKPVFFSWVNGKVGKVCFDAAESVEGQNFKKSILSNFQISSFDVASDIPAIYETDLFGRCPVQMQVSADGDKSVIISKRKDLNACKYRTGFDFVFEMSEGNAINRANPFVKSELTCTIKLEGGVVNLVETFEEYNYQPLGGYSSSHTSVFVNLRIFYVSHSKPDITGSTWFSILPADEVSSSLVYQAPKGESIAGGVPQILKALQEVVPDEASSDEEGAGEIVGKEAAKNFGKFVHLLKQANKEQILAVYQQVKSGANVKNSQHSVQIFWNGLCGASTPASVEAGVALAISKEMPEKHITLFIANFAFVKRPSEETLKAVVPLLERNGMPTSQTFLAVGSLLKKHLSDVAGLPTPALSNVIAALAKPLNSNPGKQDEIIMSLKAFGNARYADDHTLKIITNLALNKDGIPRIRVAALQTMRTMPKLGVVKAGSLEILRRKEEDGEIRIHAFLTLAEHPTAQTAAVIKELVETEESNQVGGFIVSYLRNIRASNAPEKEASKEYYGGIIPKRNFPFDLRQYSQNYEFSHLMSALNLGYSAQGDVIYSPKSYVPRSISCALNSQIFGNSFNLFQLEARMERADYYLEKFFGPESYLQKMKLEDMTEDFVAGAVNMTSRLAEGAERQKRSSYDMRDNADFEKITPQEEEFNLDLSLKMLQSELAWIKLHKQENAISSTNLADEIYEKISRAIDSMENVHIDYKRYSRFPMISDNAIYYPTSNGFPLKLSIDVNSALYFKVKGAANVRQILRNHNMADISLKVIPSFIVQVDGMLMIDASVLKMGLKASSYAHAGLGLDLSFKMLDGKGLDLNIGLPVKENTIFDMKTDAFIITEQKGAQPVESALTPVGKRYQYGGQFDQLSELTGLTLLAEINTPAFSYKPTLGPAQLTLRLIQDDPTNTRYNLKMIRNVSDEGKRRQYELTFDTPGSKINRKISLMAMSDSIDRKFILQFTSPFRNLGLETSLAASDSEYSYNVKLVDNSIEYGLNLGTRIVSEKDRTTFKPFLDVKNPENKREKGSRMKSVKPTLKLLAVDGVVVLERKPETDPQYRKYEFKDLTAITPFGKYVLDGPAYVDPLNGDYGSNLTVYYGPDGKHTFKWDSKLVYPKKPEKEYAMMLETSLKSSQWPQYGVKLVYHKKSRFGLKEGSLLLVHGPNLDSPECAITITNSLSADISPDGSVHAYKYAAKATYPLWKLAANGEFAKDNGAYSANISGYQDNNKLFLSSKMNVWSNDSYEASFHSDVNGRKCDATLVRTQLLSPAETRVLLIVKNFPGNVYNFDSNVTASNGIYRMRSMLQNTSMDTTRRYKNDIGVILNGPKTSLHFVYEKDGLKETYVNVSRENFEEKGLLSVILFLRNEIDFTYGYEYVRGNPDRKCSAFLDASIRRLNRLVKGNFNASANDNNVSGQGSLVWDAKRDITRNVSFDITFKRDGRNYASKNKLYVVGDVYEINGAKVTSDRNDTTYQGELIMPDNSKYFAKHRHFVRNLDFMSQTELMHQASPVTNPTQLTVKMMGKGQDLSRGLFDGQMVLTIKTQKNEKNAVVSSLALKRAFTNNKMWNHNLDFMLSGHSIPRRLELSIQSEFTSVPGVEGFTGSFLDNLGSLSWNTNASLGNDYILSDVGLVSKQEFTNAFESTVKNATCRWFTTNKLQSDGENYVNVKSNHSLEWEGGKFAKWTGEARFASKSGRFNYSWETHSIPVKTTEVVYDYDVSQEEMGRGRGKISIIHDNSSAFLLIECKQLEKNFIVILKGPLLGDVQITANTKMTKDGRGFSQEAALVKNGKRWFTSGEVKAEAWDMALGLVFEDEVGVRKFRGEFKAPSPSIYVAEAQASWIQNRKQITWQSEARIRTIPGDMFVKFTVHAPALNVNNWLLTATQATTAEKGNILDIAVEKDNTTFANGRIDYVARVENDKITLRGKGNVTVQDKIYTIKNVVFSRELIADKESHEEGSELKLAFDFDEGTYVLDSVMKYTNKAILLKRNLCLGGKCYRMDFQYKTKIIDMLNYERDLFVRVDLKPFVEDGDEYVIKGKTVRNSFNYNRQMSLSWNDEDKLEYSAFANPGKIGFSLILPKREMAAELHHAFKMGLKEGEVKLGAFLWLDKKNTAAPRLVSTFSADYKLPEDRHCLLGRSALQTELPFFQKNLGITVNILAAPMESKVFVLKSDIDVFKTSEQMIQVLYEVNVKKDARNISLEEIIKITSKGQHLDNEFKCIIRMGPLEGFKSDFIWTYLNNKNVSRTSKASMHLTLKSLSMGVDVFGYLPVKWDSNISLDRNGLQVWQKLDAIGHHYTATHAYTPYAESTYSLDVEWKGPVVEQKLRAKTAVKFRESATAYIAMFEGTTWKDVALFKLYLDEKKFLSTDTNLQIDHLKILLDNGKKDILKIVDDGKMAVNHIKEDMEEQITFRMEQLEEAKFPVDVVKRDLSNYMNQIRDEIKNDPALKSASKDTQKLADECLEGMRVMIQQVMNLATDWMEAFNALSAYFGDFMKATLPGIYEIAHVAAKHTEELLREIGNHFYELGHKIIEYVRANKEKWSDSIKPMADSLREILTSLYKTYEYYRKNFDKLAADLYAFLNSIPVVDYIREKWNEFIKSSYAKMLWSLILEVGNFVKDLMPTPELKNLLEAWMTAMDKILNQKSFDGMILLRNIYISTVEGLTSLIDLARKASDWKYLVANRERIRDYLPSFELLRTIPNLWITSTNFWNWFVISPENGPTITEIFQTYKPRSLNPLYWLPPYPKTAAIVGGQHVVTMNGIHYEVGSGCEYVLAADLRHYNFTITGKMGKGRMDSLTISSPGMKIEIRSGGKIKRKGEMVAFPLFEKDMKVIRTPYAMDISVGNSARVFCLPNLEVCTFKISGFYANRVYGLLGTLGNEKFTAFTKSDGKIANNVKGFVESYKMLKKCLSVDLELTGTNKNVTDMCERIFDPSNLFERGYAFAPTIEADAYQKLCRHYSMSENEPSIAACSAAIALSSAISLEDGGGELQIPDICKGSCLGGNTIENTSRGKVDVILLLDVFQYSNFENIIRDFIPALTNTLKDRKITDVSYVLISYGSDDQLPSVHTNTNGSLAFTKSTKLTVPVNAESVSTFPTPFRAFVQNLRYIFGEYAENKGVKMALEFPFRAGASKAIIHFKSGNRGKLSFDNYGACILNFPREFLNLETYRDEGIGVFSMPAANDAHFKTNKNEFINVFGFDEDKVYTPKGTFDRNVDGFLTSSKHSTMYDTSSLLPLFAKTHSATFLPNVYATSGAEDRGKFMNNFINKVMESLSARHHLQCVCTFLHGMHSKLQCYKMPT